MQLRKAVTENLTFLAGITFLGGYINGYGSVTGDGFLPNCMTSNVTKLGMNFAKGDLSGVLSCLLPISCAVLGAVLSEVVRTRASKKRDWRITAMTLQILVMALVAFLPESVPAIVGSRILCVVAGFQLCLFRNSEWGAHNTTICTGNLRSLGQYLFGAVNDRTPASLRRFLLYAVLLFSFSVGSGAAFLAASGIGRSALLLGCAEEALLIFFLLAERAEVRMISTSEAVLEEK